MKAKRNLLVIRLVSWLTVITFLSSSVSWAGVVDVQKLAAQSLIGRSVPLLNALAEGQEVLKQLRIDTISDRSEFYRRLKEMDIGDVECFDSIDPERLEARAYYVINLERRYFSRITTDLDVNDLFYKLVSGYWTSVSSEVREFKIGDKVFYQWLYSIPEGEVEFIRSCIEKTINIETNWIGIKNYLKQVKKSVHAMVRGHVLGRIVHIVLGSEACDLDSIVSSIAYAYAKAKKTPSDVLFVPIINIAKEDFHLRTEAVYLLGEVGISEEDLLYKDMIDELIHNGFKIQITLVDHNNLATEQKGLRQFEIIDHHEDEHQYPADIEKEISPVGSCSTLVAERILQMPQVLDQDPYLSLLLLGTIVLDTVNLDPKAGRVTKRDSRVVEELLKLTRVDQNDLYERIKKAREDLSSLSRADLLRKDYKGYHSGTITYGISSIFGLSLKEFIARGKDLLEDLECIRKHFKLEVLIVMPSYYKGGVFKRELLIYTANEYMMKQLVEFLGDDKDRILPIKLGETDISSSVIDPRIKAFTITPEISRKKLQPLLHTFFSSKIADDKVQPFAPTGTEEIDYSKLVGGFNDSYEVSLDLSQNRGNRFKAIGKIKNTNNLEPKAINLAELLNNAMDGLEGILAGNELGKYWRDLVWSKHNRAPPIRIRVNSLLPSNSVRYHNPVTGEVEIIFNEDFITTILADYNDCPQIVYLLAERIFHELGHSPVKSFYQELKQEYELLKRDVELHELLQGRGIQGYIDRYFMERNPRFPSGGYFRLIEELIKDKQVAPGRKVEAEKELGVARKFEKELEAKYKAIMEQTKDENVIKNAKQKYERAVDTRKLWEGKLRKAPSTLDDFDTLIKEIELLEKDTNEVYQNPQNYEIEDLDQKPACKARNERIEKAFQIGDPDNVSSITNRLKGEKAIEGSFLSTFLEVLTHRAVACGRESFLFLAEKGLVVVPFNQLKMPRVPTDRDAPKDPPWMKTVVPPEKEKERWARQYCAIHKGRRFSDGIGVTEAENGRGMQQRWHKHDTTQEFTISLCDDTQLRYGHELAKGIPTEMRDGKEYVASGPDKGKPVEIGKDEKECDVKIVVDKTEDVPFGKIICMPKQLYHTLRNKSRTRPSIDFTVKDPVTQIIKTFSPPQEKLFKDVDVKPIDMEKITGGEQYTLVYPADYCSKMLIDSETGEMLYVFDKDGKPVPVMYDPVQIILQLVVVDNSAETVQYLFTPFYDDMQVIRIFPWPREVPADKEELQSEHEWVLDRDHTQIKAEIIIYDKNGTEVERRNAFGGDLVILDASLREKYGDFKFSIKNTSDEQHRLVFYTLSPKMDNIATFKNLLGLTQVNKQDVREAGRRLLKDFIGRQDDSTLAMLLQRALDERLSADELSEIIRAFVLLPEGEGLDRFKGLQQKFMVYSAPPGTGKDEVMKATFEGKPVEGIKGKYQDIIGKLILYHTRDPRVKKGVCEKDGEAYHFRMNKRLEELNKEGEIEIAVVNRQEQGLAYNSFSEKGVEIKNVFGDDKLKVNDEIINYGMVTGVVTVKRNGELIEIQDVYIPLDKPGIFKPGDVVEDISGDIVIVLRKIKGMDSVFDGQLPVILEGGYDWFRKLSVKFSGILSVFISFFSEEEIEIRAKNTEWIRKQFETVEEKVLAYSEIARLICDDKKREIDLENETELKKMIVDFVNKVDKKGIDPIELANAELIESTDFIEDLNNLLRNFGKEPILPEEESMIQAIAYEVNRRTVSRDGLVMFSRTENPERYTPAKVDPNYDRYNRVLEGVVQFRHRNEYDHIVVNPWGYTPEAVKTIIDNLTEEFSRLFFVSLIKGMVDSLNPKTGKVDLKSTGIVSTEMEVKGVDSAEEFLWIFDAMGNVVGKKKRADVHRDGDWHAGTWILAFDQRGNILLQQRSYDKNAYPGCWEFSASGHIPYGKSYSETAVKEVKEELGLDISPDRLIPFGDEGGFVQNREVTDEYMKPDAKKYAERERLSLYLLILTDEELNSVKPNSEVLATRRVNLEQLREEMEQKPTDFTLTLQDILMNKKNYKEIKRIVKENASKFCDKPNWQDVIGADWCEYLAGGFKRGRYKIAKENNPDIVNFGFNFRFDLGFTLRDIFIHRIPEIVKGTMGFKVIVSDNWFSQLEKMGIKFSDRQKNRYRERVGRLFENPGLTEEELYSGILALRKFFFGDKAGVLVKIDGKEVPKTFSELGEIVIEENKENIGKFLSLINKVSWLERVRLACLADSTKNPEQMIGIQPAVDDYQDFVSEVLTTEKPVHYVHFVGSVSSLAVDLKIFADLLINEWSNGSTLEELKNKRYKVSFVVKDKRTVSNFKDSYISSTIDSTKEDILALLELEEFKGLKEAYNQGLFEIIVSGSEMVGTDLRKASPELVELLLKIKGYQENTDSIVKGVVGLKGEENNITINLIGLNHYRFFLSRQTKTQFCTDYMYDGESIPPIFILRVPAGIEIFKEICPKRVRRLTVRQYIEARKRLKSEGIEDSKFKEILLKRRKEAGKYLTVVEALAPKVLLDEALRDKITTDELKVLIDQSPDAYWAIIEKNRELRRTFAREVTDSIGGEYSTSTAYLYPVRDTADAIMVTEREGKDSIGQVITHIFSLPSGELIPVFAAEFGGIQLVSPRVVSKERCYNNSVIINGLYFWTKPLNDSYNDCRKFRTWEKMEEYGYCVGEKIENGNVIALPCFNKGFVAKKKDGSLVFGTWRLGAGKIKITSGDEVEWGEKNINPRSSELLPVEVYTPLHYENLLQGTGRGRCVLVGEKGEQELQILDEINKNTPPVGTRYGDNKFEIKVGDGRYNLIIIGNQIRHIVYGDVFIPSTGIVISMDKMMFNKKFKKYIEVDKEKMEKHKRELGDRVIYKWKSEPVVSFNLSLPEELKDVEWCLGGGALIVNGGKALQSYDELVEELRNQGWFNPLSMKTQETSVEKIWIQPRMAMGITMDDRFFAIAYDGRQVDSVGANLGEMYKIAEQKLGKIKYLLNLDSGASVSMNFIDNEGNFVTVNTTTEVPNQTATDQLRAVNSMFVINEADKAQKTKTSQYFRMVDETKKEEILYKAILDTNGNIVGEEFREESEKNEKFVRFFSKTKLIAVLEQIKVIYDVGIFGVAKEILIVDNLGGLDSMAKDEKGAIAVFQDGKILIDIDAFRNDRVLRDVVEHELLESILELVESNPGVREATAIYQNLKAFVDMPETEQRALIEFLSQSENGLDSQGYAELLQYVVDNKIRGDGLISMAVGYVVREPRYNYLRNSIAEALNVVDAQMALQEILNVSFHSTGAVGLIIGEEIKKACEKLNLATEIYSDLINVTTEWKPVINKVKSAELKSKAIMKIRMIVNRMLVVELGFIDTLLQNNKFIRLDMDELNKPENKYVMDWINRITEGKEKSPFIFSDEDVPEGVKQEDIIYLIEPGKVTDGLPEDNLYLPLPYSISSIYLSSQVVLAGGKVGEIRDKLALNTIRALYETLLGRDVTSAELEELFRRPWTILPAITQISATLDVLRKAIVEIEIAV